MRWPWQRWADLRAERERAEAEAARVEITLSIPLREMRENDHLNSAVQDEMRKRLGGEPA